MKSFLENFRREDRMTEKALITIEKLDVAVLFTGDGMDRILKGIETKAMAHVPDVSTEQGRRDIASMAFKVARSKTLIVDMIDGKIEDHKKKVNEGNGFKKIARDFLDDLKSLVRLPLDEWDEKQAEIEAEEARKQKEIIDARIAGLAKFNVHMPFFDVAAMADDVFDITLVNARLAYADEQKRLTDEEAARKAEAERLEKVRQEQEIMAENLRKAQREIEAEKKAFEDEKKAEQERREREAFEKQTAENARIKAEKDAKEKADREIAEKVEAEKRTKAEAERQEALKPDKEKLFALAQFLQEGIKYPVTQASDAIAMVEDVAVQVQMIASELLKNIEEL